MKEKVEPQSRTENEIDHLLADLRTAGEEVDELARLKKVTWEANLPQSMHVPGAVERVSEQYKKAWEKYEDIQFRFMLTGQALGNPSNSMLDSEDTWRERMKDFYSRWPERAELDIKEGKKRVYYRLFSSYLLNSQYTERVLNACDSNLELRTNLLKLVKEVIENPDDKKWIIDFLANKENASLADQAYMRLNK